MIRNFLLIKNKLMKQFFKTFALLFIIELLFGFFALYASIYISNNFVNIFIDRLTMLFSYPIRIFNASYPYYATQGFNTQFILVISNIVLQTMVIILIIKLFENYNHQKK